MSHQMCFYHNPGLRNIVFPNLGGVNQAAATAKQEADDNLILVLIDTPPQVVSYGYWEQHPISIWLILLVHL